MKKQLFSLAMLVLGISTQAQSEIFALTGQSGNQIVFKDFRSLDLKSGKTNQLFLTSDASPQVFSDRTKTKIDETKDLVGGSQAIAMAAMSLDATGNYLVYTPMYSNKIYSLDLKTKNISLIENNASKVTACDINTHFTRMTTGFDGNIYALNNAGTQLLKIANNNGQYSVTDLGEIKNDASNGDNRLQVLNIGFGGDLVADTQNNLYIFSASGNVFQFNPNEKVAKFLGKITGLPENYSLNGAAVNDNGAVVVGSAKGGNLYEVSMENLTAKALYGGEQNPIYDLASKYFIGEKGMDISMNVNDVYPTKVTDGIINIKLDNSYTRVTIKAEIFNMMGTKVVDKLLVSDRKISLAGLPQGMYIVAILGEKGETIINKKILIAR
jgi:hypothetical protein